MYTDITVQLSTQCAHVAQTHTHTLDCSLLRSLYSKQGQSLFELPLLSTHWTELIDLLRVEPLHNAVNMEAV